MDERFYIGGKHAVLSAISNPNRKVHEVYLIEQNNSFVFKNIKIVKKDFFNKIFGKINLNHQNIAALISPREKIYLKNEIKKNSIKKIIILNGVSDQRNIGSIMRTSLAFNVDGIILEKKYFNQKNPLMIKASSGAIEYLNFFIVSNIKNEIKTLQKEGFWIVGFDSKSKKKFENIDTNQKIALVFGAEDLGIMNSVMKNCDEIAKIEINKKINSLNVSNTVAAVLAVLNYKKS